MLSTEYLLHGLNAMSRAHEADYFKNGHLAGAVISAYYLCRDRDVEDGVADILATRMSQDWLSSPLFAPVPDEPAEPALVSRIVEVMRDHIAGVRQVGHNVILPTLALKAFQDVPEAVTPLRVEGIGELVPAFQRTELPMDEAFDLPAGDDQRLFAEFVLEEFIGSTERFVGRGQVWSGHLLTSATALLDLQDLGHHGLARQAEDGFTMYVRRLRLGPLDSDEPRQEHPPTTVLPLERAYWERKAGGDWSFGHVTKYPYGFYRLMNLARDTELKARCLDVAYRIF
jgi:hypothetical protein